MNTMKNCTECGGQMRQLVDKTPEGIPYRYYRCRKCAEEIVDMKQLRAVASEYRLIKKYHVKLSRWGLSLGMRIPKEVVKRYNLKSNEEVIIVPESEGLKIIPSED